MRNRKKREKRTLRLALLLLPLVLAGAMLSQTVLATTYTITDGDRVVTYTTFATDPAQVLGQAGLELSEGDTYTTEADSITINRTHRVTVCYHGRTMTEPVSGETVGALLARLNLNPGPQDVVVPGVDTPVTDDMQIRVDQVIREEQTYTRTIPHEVTRCDDSSLPRGTERVLVEGRDGELICSARVTYCNGQETEREVLGENVTVQPVTEVVAVGTAEPAQEEKEVIIGDGYILLPTGEKLTYTRKDTVRATAYTHTDAGCDMITSTGSTVRKGTVAVDPRFIPYGTRMFIVSNDGEVVYGLCAAEDCGGAIKRDRVDLYFPTYKECMDFGRRTCTIYFLG